MVLVLAACAGPTVPSASPLLASPSPSATSSVPISPLPTSTTLASEAPTAEPAARGWAQDPPKPLLLGRAVRVTVAELNVRFRPSTSARVVGTVRADHVLAISQLPPIESAGYLWYHGLTVSIDGELPPLPDNPVDRQDGIGGWFAAMKGSMPYVAPLPPRCPETVDLENLGAMLPAEQLACFGDESIEVEGTYGCPPCTGVYRGEFQPKWLADPAIYNLVSEVGASLEGSRLPVRFRPDAPRPPTDGSIIRIRGHFDDPAASDCSMSMPDPWVDNNDFHVEPVPSAVARLWCRQMFVVENYRVIGTDPNLPGPQ
jgi:hypothetical protein